MKTKKEILEEIKKILQIKNSDTFTCSPPNSKVKCEHEASGWNSARFHILQHFEKIPEVDLDF
jgi:hypothetical protein